MLSPSARTLQDPKQPRITRLLSETAQARAAEDSRQNDQGPFCLKQAKGPRLKGDVDPLKEEDAHGAVKLEGEEPVGSGAKEPIPESEAEPGATQIGIMGQIDSLAQNMLMPVEQAGGACSSTDEQEAAAPGQDATPGDNGAAPEDADEPDELGTQTSSHMATQEYCPVSAQSDEGLTQTYGEGAVDNPLQEAGEQRVPAAGAEEEDAAEARETVEKPRKRRRLQVRLPIYMFVSVCVYIYIYTPTHVCFAHKHTHTYTHTHTHTLSLSLSLAGSLALMLFKTSLATYDFMTFEARSASESREAHIPKP